MTACTSSPTITTSGASNTSASSVAPTAPSREFSIGTSPYSTLPSCTASRTAPSVGSATGSTAAPAETSASCEFVPGGPR